MVLVSVTPTAHSAERSTAQTHDDVWEAAVSRLSAGVRLADILDQPGMPRHSQWYARLRKDAAFAGRVCALVRPGGQAPATPQQLEAVLAAFQAGAKTLREATSQPGVPSLPTVRKYVVSDAMFAARLAPYWKPRPPGGKYSKAELTKAVSLVEQGTAFRELSDLGLPSRTALVIAARRDPGLARRVFGHGAAQRKARAEKHEAIVQAVEAGAPLTKALRGQVALSSFYGYVSRNGLTDRVGAALKRAGRGVHQAYKPEDFTRALQAVQDGRSIRKLRELGLPGDSALLKYRAKNPDYDARFKVALSLNGGNVREEDVHLRRALSQNEIWSAVNAAVSRGLATFVRDDVIGEMVADVIEGFLDVADVRGAAREYVSEHFRESGGQRMRSLDADLYGDGGRTLHDVLAG